MYDTPQCIPGRDTPLLVDLDPVMYAAVAKADCLGQAVENVEESVRWLCSNAGGMHLTLVYTPPGSRKGNRRLIASREVYQGQRAYKAGSLVSGLRVWLDTREGVAGHPLVSSGDLEADDTIADLAHNKPVAIWSTDKDLRQINCIHFNLGAGFVDNIDGQQAYMLGAYYGERWFWQQMLIGDRVDAIPSVGVSLSGRRMGPAEASKLLDPIPSSEWGPAVFRCFKRNFGAGASRVFTEQMYLVGLGRPQTGRLVTTGPKDALEHLIGGEYDACEQDAIRRHINTHCAEIKSKGDCTAADCTVAAPEETMWDLLWND